MTTSRQESVFMRRECKKVSILLGAATQVAPNKIKIVEFPKSQISAKNKHNNTTSQHFIIKYIKNDIVAMYIKLNLNYIFKSYIFVAFCYICCVYVVFMLCFAPICCVLTSVFNVFSSSTRDIKEGAQKSKHNKNHVFSETQHKHNKMRKKLKVIMY